MRTPTLSLISALLFLACSPSTVSPDGDTSPDEFLDTGELQDFTEDDVYPDMEGVDSSMCGEDYSLCGDLLIPSSLVGNTRSLVVALYSSIPPAGPPDGIVAQIDGPDIMPGYRYPVRELPVLFTGEFYLWVNLYMEGGGEWAPVNDVDYTGNTPNTLNLNGSGLEFDDIILAPASGW